MTRDELVETMARAHYAKYFEVVADMEPAFHEQPESHQDRMREAMESVLAAIEAAGLCIVPREATWDQIDAIRLALRNTRVSPVSVMSIDGQYETEHAREFAAHRAMIKAGKL